MGVGTRGGGGLQGARAPPPNNFAKWNFPYSVCTLIKEIGRKMFIFSKIFRLASLANQDTSN